MYMDYSSMEHGSPGTLGFWGNWESWSSKTWNKSQLYATSQARETSAVLIAPLSKRRLRSLFKIPAV